MKIGDDKIREIVYNKGITVREKYCLIYGEEPLTRDIARHAIDRLKMQLPYGGVYNVTPTFTESFKVNANGTQESMKLLSCSSSEIRDEAFLLSEHGFDANEFTIVSARHSVWQGGKGNEVKYSSRVTVKPREKVIDIVKLVSSAVESLKDQKSYVQTKCSCKEGNFSSKTLELCLADLHIGLTDLDGNIDYSRVDEAFIKAINFIDNNKINKVVLAFLGDIFHYDTKGKTTTKGTQQDSLVSFEKAYTIASEKLVRFMADLAKRCNNIDVIYVPGNHDELLGYTLMNMLKMLFISNECFKFNIEQQQRKFLFIEDNLVGFLHGDMNQKNIMKWIYTDAKELVSKSKSIEIHAGHFHCEKVIEDGGVILRHMPSLSNLSPWEDTMGYTHRQRMCGCLWDKDAGLEEIVYF